MTVHQYCSDLGACLDALLLLPIAEDIVLALVLGVLRGDTLLLKITRPEAAPGDRVALTLPPPLLLPMPLPLPP